jgi:hypothetical protein
LNTSYTFATGAPFDAAGVQALYKQFGRSHSKGKSLGIATKRVEALLSVTYRVVTKEGHTAEGPMYVLGRGMKQRWRGAIEMAGTIKRRTRS